MLSINDRELIQRRASGGIPSRLIVLLLLLIVPQARTEAGSQLWLRCVPAEFPAAVFDMKRLGGLHLSGISQVAAILIEEYFVGGDEQAVSRLMRRADCSA